VNTTAAQRAEAARLLHRVVSRRQTTDQLVAPADLSPLTQELVYGSLRHYFSLRQVVQSALHRPLNNKDLEIEALLIVGAYQLFHTRIPDHAAIAETVDAAPLLGRPWAKGLVNAVLRKCASRPAPFERSFDHPQWLESALRAEHPEPEALMTANNQRAPMTIRINVGRTSADAYLAVLADAGIETRPAEARPVEGRKADGLTWLGPETRVLSAPIPSRRLPGYGAGLVSIQDAGAQMVAHLLAPAPGERLLDACAAPGGKLFHLMERHPGAEWTALEKNVRRLDQLDQEAKRLGHDDYQSIAADATTLDWWDGRPYQHVLIDAPCSGTGTLRRHPDIKLLRRPEEIPEFAELQGRLLANLWQVLAPGGKLLYCTCSILAAENDGVVGGFVQRHEDAELDELGIASGRATRYGWQLLPTEPDTDGFYFARMTKARI
jgi:16S rRNA (cytosine967-C5)-methyltransferase